MSLLISGSCKSRESTYDKFMINGILQERDCSWDVPHYTHLHFSVIR